MNHDSSQVNRVLKGFKQYVRFLMIGAIATLVHLIGFVALIELYSLSALTSNILAFTLAVLVSFVGHFIWTFRDQTQHIKLHRAQRQLTRFIFAALVGAMMNSTIAWFMVDFHGINYLYALLPIALVVPIITFIINSRWVFTDPNPPS